MFGTLIRGFCLSATTESGQSRWQPLLCSKLDAAGVQAVSTLRIDESPKNGAMLQDVLPGIGQMMPDGGVLLFTFLWISEHMVWLFENIILVLFTQAACLCTLICIFVLFREDVAAFRAAFGLAAQDPALPLPRREGEHGTTFGGIPPRLDKLWEIWMFLQF